MGSKSVEMEMEHDGVDMGMSGYMKAWFVLCGLLGLASFFGVAYVVYLLLAHFNVLVMGGLL
jgi:hypothetical protein